jgi:hypothetical protein
MPGVLLMNGFYSSRMAATVLIRDNGGTVGRAVVDNDNLDFVAPCQKGINAMAHIILRVVTGDDDT